MCSGWILGSFWGSWLGRGSYLPGPEAQSPDARSPHRRGGDSCAWPPGVSCTIGIRGTARGPDLHKGRGGGIVNGGTGDSRRWIRRMSRRREERARGDGPWTDMSCREELEERPGKLQIGEQQPGDAPVDGRVRDRVPPRNAWARFPDRTGRGMSLALRRRPRVVAPGSPPGPGPLQPASRRRGSMAGRSRVTAPSRRLQGHLRVRNHMGSRSAPYASTPASCRPSRVPTGLARAHTGQAAPVRRRGTRHMRLPAVPFIHPPLLRRPSDRSAPTAGPSWYCVRGGTWSSVFPQRDGVVER